MPGMGMIGGTAALMGGSALSGAGDSAGGYDSAKGTAMKTAGTALQVGGALGMMGAGDVKMPKGLGKAGKLGKFGSSGGAMGAAGLAGVASIGAGAYGAGSVIGGQFHDDSVKSKGTSAMASAAVGAGIGAAIGSIIPVIGTGVGAAIGGIIGGITGYVKAGARRKEIRNSTKDMMENYNEQVNEAFAGGNVDALQKARSEMEKAREQMLASSADPAYQAEVLKKYADDLSKVSKQIDNLTNNARIADTYFGTSAETLMQLGEDAGIVVKDKMMTFRDVLGLVGKTAEDQARLMKTAWANIGAKATSEALGYFDKKAEEREQGKALNAAEEKLLTGDTSMASQEGYLKSLIQYNVGQFGDVGGLTNAFSSLESDLGEGGRFAGLDEETKGSMRKELALAGVTPEGIMKNIDIQELTDLSGGIGNMGQFKGVDGALDPNKIQQFITDGIKADPLFLQKYIGAASNTSTTNAGTQMQGLVNSAGFGAGSQGNFQGADRVGQTSGAVPPSSTGQTNVVTTTINASVLDKNTVDQIERAIAKALKEAQERGQTTPVTTGGSRGGR